MAKYKNTYFLFCNFRMVLKKYGEVQARPFRIGTSSIPRQSVQINM